LPVFVLGGGSNLVISDSGFAGLVVRSNVKGIDMTEGSDGRVLVTAGAGENWDGFVKFCAERNLQGVECLAGIPGAVGGTPVQNVGAYGQEVSETIASVHAFDTERETVYNFPPDECEFAYRRSRFNTTESGRWVILSVTFALTPNAPPALRYADLRNHFDGQPTPSLTDVYHAVRAIRAKKGMVHGDGDPDSVSAGSFFKNPQVEPAVYERIAAQFDQSGENATVIPHWPQPDGTVKLSAAWLMERAGLQRGMAHGNVGLSSKHVLALVNRGGATSAEVCQFARFVQETVSEKWSVDLSPEPVFVGFGESDLLPARAVCYP
jgi:UDP-N-acetylmuramate dehydrogenase